MVHIFPIVLFLTVVACDQHDAPELVVPQGTIRGKYLQSRKGRIFNAFIGIPYAKPPIGGLRFKSPIPAESWHGILDASKSHPICPQSRQVLGEVSVLGNEDCLYLNVYTPQTSNLLPVMVYIHGGAFDFLSGRPEDHGPELLLDKDIILVVPNYRLGALGFLSTGDEEVPGNNGLKDQSLAIKWVKNNIAYFGGDPDKLTLFGESAGGCSVNLHLLSPLNEGLIQGAISQSGTALSPRGLTPNDQGMLNSQKLAQLLHCPTNSSKEMADCLRNVDAHDVVWQQNKFKPWKLDRLSGFRPVIEPDLAGAFLAQHPIDVYQTGKAANVPFMTGLTTEDSPPKVPLLFTAPGLLEEFNLHFNTIAPIGLLYEDTAPYAADVTGKIKKFYFDGAAISNSSKSEVVKMYMDGLVLMGEEGAVHLHHAYVEKPVYYYLFGYRASVSFCEGMDRSYDYGVCHTDDLLHLLTVGFLPKYNLTQADEKVVEVMLELWTNFAKTGNPTPGDTSLPKWDHVQNKKLQQYVIKGDTNIKMDNSPFEERVKFWNSLPINFRSYHVTSEMETK